MFWKKKPTEAERLTEEAVELACDKFTTGGLYGSDGSGWTDADREEGHAAAIAYYPKSYGPVLCIHGRAFGLTKGQAERINNVITRRVIDAQRKED